MNMNDEILAKILGMQELMLKELAELRKEISETKTIALNTKKDVEDIEAEQKVMKADIEDIKAEQKVMKADIEDIKAEQKVMKVDIEDIKERQQVMEIDIENLKAQVETLKDYGSTIEKDVSETLQVIMNNVDGRLKKLEVAIS